MADKMAAMMAVLNKAKAAQSGAGDPEDGPLVTCPMCEGTGKVEQEDADEYNASPLAKDEAAEDQGEA